MIDYRRIPVTVIIVDSGPLISLAVSDKLHLLDEFAREIQITDVVKAECLRYPGRLGADTLQSWFSNLGSERYQLIRTPFLYNWQDAVRLEESGDETRPSEGIGDASIAWLIHRLNHTKAQDEIILYAIDAIVPQNARELWPREICGRNHP